MAEDSGEVARSEATPTPYIPLPTDLVDPRRQAGAVFDTIASLYDGARPGYPPEVFVELAAQCGVGPDKRVLEIGCGSGQATRDLARSGAEICCVEPGPSLADLARENLGAWPNVTVHTTSFEAADLQPHSFDTIFSATAFHWVDPRVSFAKAAKLLGVDGCLALLTSLHGAAGTHNDKRIAEPIRELQRRLAPEVGDWRYSSAADMRRRSETGGDIAAVWARIERKLGEPPSVEHLFTSPMIFTYPWLATYDRDGFQAMLATQSSYALMARHRRDRLLQAIGQLIDDRLGGVVTKQYVSVLAVAKVRPASHTTTHGTKPRLV